jgi:peptide-N4-(N-acetyl-beta-glucosaminyl)asparagine amidase
MLFGAILNSLSIQTRIAHDYLDHCWNESLINGKRIHVDSTLDYPFSFNHPHYYETNWGKKYSYVLPFWYNSLEDVTQRYTQQWSIVRQRRRKKVGGF